MSNLITDTDKLNEIRKLMDDLSCSNGGCSLRRNSRTGQVTNAGCNCKRMLTALNSPFFGKLKEIVG